MSTRWLLSKPTCSHHPRAAVGCIQAALGLLVANLPMLPWAAAVSSAALPSRCSLSATAFALAVPDSLPLLFRSNVMSSGTLGAAIEGSLAGSHIPFDEVSALKHRFSLARFSPPVLALAAFGQRPERPLAFGCAAGRKGIAISFPFKGWNTWTATDIQQAVQVPSMLYGLQKPVSQRVRLSCLC